MKVYLFRHGQKDSHPFEDPDLTAFGHQQARQLAAFVSSGEYIRGTHFLASPRIRAQSTLRAAALVCAQEVHIVSDLDQRTSFESAEAFRARIEHFLHSLERKFNPEDVLYLCTHHDWIEESLSLIPADTDLLDSQYWSWRPTQYMFFEVQDGLWILKNFSRIEV